MSESSFHLSRLQLDLHLAGEQVEDAAHLAGCPRCRQRLARMSADYDAFSQRYSDLAALGRNGRVVASVPETATRRLFLAWGAAASLAAAMVVVGLWLLPSAPLPLDSLTEPTERAKGASVVEIAVQRDGESRRYVGQPLWPGDVLAFRVTTRWRFLLLLSLEQDGRISVFLTDPGGRHSMSITPGQQQVLSSGVELNDYVGPERLVLLLSDRPLSVAEVRRKIRRRFRTLRGNQLRSLELGPLASEGETHTWLLNKVER